MQTDQPAIRIDGDEQDFVHVTLGRSGKRAIVSIGGPSGSDLRQRTLTPDDALQLARFLAAGPERS